MGILTTKDVGALVKKANKLYQPKGKCSRLADRPHMQLLVTRLRSYTEQVQAEADRLGLVEDENVAQWATDMAYWRQRLAAYQEALDAAVKPSGRPSCEEIYDTVVGPLLNGNFTKASADGTAGIVNPAVRTVPDVAVAYMLGNQVVVYREFQAENFAALMGYFIESAKELGKKVAKAAKSAAPSVLAIGVGLALGAVALNHVAGTVKKRVARPWGRAE